MSTTWLTGILTALSGFAALIALWRYSWVNRTALRDIERRLNQHERALAKLLGTDPEPLDITPFDDD